MAVLFTATSDVWVRLPTGVVVASHYRLWRPAEGIEAAAEALLGRVRDVASKHRHVIVSSDFNLDADRLDDVSYPHRRLASSFMDEMESVGLGFAGPDVLTYISYGRYGDNHAHRCSRIDHVYSISSSSSFDLVVPSVGEVKKPSPSKPGHRQRRGQDSGRREEGGQDLN